MPSREDGPFSTDLKAMERASKCGSVKRRLPTTKDKAQEYSPRDSYGLSWSIFAKNPSLSLTDGIQVDGSQDFSGMIRTLNGVSHE